MGTVDLSISLTIPLVDVNKPPGVLRCIKRHSAFSFSAFSIALWIYSADAGLMPPSIFIETTFCATSNAGKKKHTARNINRFIKLFSRGWNSIVQDTVIYQKREAKQKLSTCMSKYYDFIAAVESNLC